MVGQMAQASKRIKVLKAEARARLSKMVRACESRVLALRRRAASSIKLSLVSRRHWPQGLRKCILCSGVHFPSVVGLPARFVKSRARLLSVSCYYFVRTPFEEPSARASLVTWRLFFCIRSQKNPSCTAATRFVFYSSAML